MSISEKEIDEEIAKHKEEMMADDFSLWATELFEDGAKFMLKLIKEVKK